jgi:hypothetical protein
MLFLYGCLSVITSKARILSGTCCACKSIFRGSICRRPFCKLFGCAQLLHYFFRIFYTGIIKIFPVIFHDIFCFLRRNTMQVIL